MIDAAKALEIANEEAERLGWGGVTSDSYEASSFTSQGTPVWLIDLKDRMRIGKRLRFTIDAATGTIRECRRMGVR
jgi:hypothetical protein